MSESIQPPVPDSDVVRAHLAMAEQVQEVWRHRHASAQECHQAIGSYVLTCLLSAERFPDEPVEEAFASGLTFVGVESTTTDLLTNLYTNKKAIDYFTRLKFVVEGQEPQGIKRRGNKIDFDEAAFVAGILHKQAQNK